MTLRERIREGIDEEIIDISVPQVMEETVEAVKLIPQDKVQNCTLEQIVAVPLPRIREETGEVIQLLSQDRVSDQVIEQIIDCSVPQIREPSVEVAKVIPEERLQERTVEQIADVPVPGNNQPGILTQVSERECARTKVNNLLVNFHLLEMQHATCGVAHIGATFDIDAKEVLNASVQDKSTGKPNQISITNERMLPAEIDRMAQDAEKYRDENEAMKTMKPAQETASTQQPHRSQQDQAGQEEKRGDVEKGKGKDEKEEETEKGNKKRKRVGEKRS